MWCDRGRCGGAARTCRGLGLLWRRVVAATTGAAVVRTTGEYDRVDGTTGALLVPVEADTCVLSVPVEELDVGSRTTGAAGVEV